MGPEHDPFFCNFPHFSQAEDLEAAGVRKHPPVVVHKFVQAPGLLHQLRARTEEQVVGIGQNHLGVHGVEFFRGQGLYRGLGTYGHEHGGVKGAVGSVQLAQPGPAAGVFFNQFEIDLAHGISFTE